MRAVDLQSELARYEFSLPIMRELKNYLMANSALEGKTIGWHCHLTETTAAAAQVLLETGANLVLSECDASTTNNEAVAYMQDRGAHIYLGAPDTTCRQVLKHTPLLLADTGFQLISTYLESFKDAPGTVFACSEITTTGITSLRSKKSRLNLPVININGGELKSRIENYHGVGDGVVDLLFELTGRIWAGRRATVVGYGAVGAGVSNCLRRLGCEVSVSEANPVRQLIAHYDGFTLKSLDEALAGSQLLVTATGSANLISGAQAWNQAADGLIIVNVGHRAEELNLESLVSLPAQKTQINENLSLYTVIETGKKIYVVANGNPANVVMLSGSAEPTLIHLTTEVLCMNYLAEMHQSQRMLSAGELPLPAVIEQQASRLALKALNIATS